MSSLPGSLDTALQISPQLGTSITHFYAARPGPNGVPFSSVVVQARTTTKKVGEVSQDLLEVIAQPDQCKFEFLEPGQWFICDGPIRELTHSQWSELFVRKFPKEKLPQGSCSPQRCCVII